MSKKVSYKIPGNWDMNVWINDDCNTATNENIQLAVLCVIRDELKALNALLHCPNFTDIPSILRQVRKNTTKRKKRPAKVKPKLRVVNG